MKRTLSFLIMLLLVSSAFGQINEEYNLDSLIVRLNTSKDTLAGVKEYTDQIAEIFIAGVPDDHKSFQKLITDVLEVAKKLDDQEGIGWANYNLAKFEIGINSGYSKALPLLLEAASFFNDANNKFGVSQCYMQMGVISYVSEYYEDAIKNFEVSLSYFDNPTSIYLMAISYSELNNLVKSKTLFHSAIKKFNDLERSKSLNECYLYLGRLYVQEGLLDSAFYYLNTALENLKALYDVEVVSRPYSLLSEYYFAKGELNVAEFYALASIENSKDGNDDLSPIIASKVLAKIYEEQGKFDKAFFYLKLNYTLKNESFEGGFKQKIDEIQTIFEFKKKNEEQKRRYQEEIKEKNRSRNITLISALFTLLLAAGLWSRLHYVRKSKSALQKEKNISESLLLNILPEEIAQELKKNGEAKARSFDLVSILFTDFKGFTEQSAKLNPTELVSEINYCFQAFDGIIEKYNVEKIKTIGDAYMAAGGLPVPTDDSVKNTVFAALEMQDFISKRKTEMDAAGKLAFEMRVGIHTGPVVAGIVGVKKFQYDIWGDTVNTANRMESSGAVGQVNISQATYELLKDDQAFSFKSRGKIEAKGKGTLDMYFVFLNKHL